MTGALLRRGLGLHAEMKEKVDFEIKLPTWGLLMLASTGLVYFVLMFMVCSFIPRISSI